MKVYLDNAATTQVDSKILGLVRKYFRGNFGNASSFHSYGQEARAAVDLARKSIAQLLNCEETEIVFNSGGSESDNLIIRGISEALSANKAKPHIITSKIEHKAVLETVRSLEKRGSVGATYVSANKSGCVDVEEIEKSIRENTVLVSIIYVNNETGTVQPIREIGKMLERVNKKRQKNNKQKIYFHSDAVQAAQFLDIDTKYLHLDAMTLSAHKLYGPKGVGVLFVKKGLPLNPQITGGKQEYGRRAGTENVAFIVAMANVLGEAQKKRKAQAKRINILRKYFEKRILSEIKNARINGEGGVRAPHIANLSFIGAEGESIVLALDLEGVAVSSGSACTSGSLEPSHVLLAMGIKPLHAQSSVRFSLGKNNTKAELDYVIAKLKRIIKRLRSISSI